MTAPKVLIPLLGKKYEAALLKKLVSAGYIVMELSEDDCFEDCYSDFCASSTALSTVIIDIDNVSCISSVIRAVHMTVNKPKIILLTSLLTWCGETSHRAVTNLDRDFCSRVPLQCSMKAYGLENTLWNIASDVMEENNKTYFVGTGLLYGGSGWDFERALRSLIFYKMTSGGIIFTSRKSQSMY
jgi:hypothetical protein